MSQWTHVNASFRLDSFGVITDEEIYDVFGRHVGYDDLYDYDGEYKSTPMGSEGSLQISIWHNPKTDRVASTQVSVFGDLRDFVRDFGGKSDIAKLKEWFDECCSKFCIRQAFIQIRDDYEKDEIIYTYKN